MSNLSCTVCGGPRDIGRKQCHECYKKAARERSKKRHALGIRTRYTIECRICEKAYVTTHKNSLLCMECFTRSRSKLKGSITYKFIKKNIREHREIAERILGRNLHTKEHVHHLDGDSLNNELRNLIILSNVHHAQMHRHINIALSIIDKNDSISSFGIKLLKKDVALSFIYENSIPSIKLWEINAPMGELVDPQGREPCEQ